MNFLEPNQSQKKKLLKDARSKRELTMLNLVKCKKSPKECGQFNVRNGIELYELCKFVCE